MNRLPKQEYVDLNHHIEKYPDNAAMTFRRIFRKNNPFGHDSGTDLGRKIYE